MYVVFTGVGYKTFDDEESAYEFCKECGITWIDYGGWE